MTIKQTVTVQFSEQQEKETIVDFLDTLMGFCENFTTCDECPLQAQCDALRCEGTLAEFSSALKHYLLDKER